MAIVEKVTLIREKVESELKTFTVAKNRNRIKAWGFRLVTAFLAGATTVLLGIQSDQWQAFTRTLALILSAFVTFLGIADSFYNYRAMWVRYTQSVNELRGILASLDFLTAGGLDSAKEEDVDKLFKQYQKILQETSEWWRSLRKEGRPKESV